MLQQIKNRFPGIGCAYADATGNITTEYLGSADRESNIPVDAHTVFPACSMSKFVTAICLMKLHEAQVIDIDAPVNRYLRQWKLPKADGTESAATIREIMSHTAGILDGEDGFYGLRLGDPEISLADILLGRTFYNNRPVREEIPHGTAYEYSDAGYCVLQLLAEEQMGKPFADVAKEVLFDKLHLISTFYASPKNLAQFESVLATGYDGDGSPLPGKFLPCPDLSGAGLWSTPRELLTIAGEFIAAWNGRSDFLRESSAKAMATPLAAFPWAGLGLFVTGDDGLMTQGWGENGQSMMKFHCRTGKISLVMTNRNPEMPQSESGVEQLVERNLKSI